MALPANVRLDRPARLQQQCPKAGVHCCEAETPNAGGGLRPNGTRCGSLSATLLVAVRMVRPSTTRTCDLLVQRTLFAALLHSFLNCVPTRRAVSDRIQQTGRRPLECRRRKDAESGTFKRGCDPMGPVNRPCGVPFQGNLATLPRDLWPRAREHRVLMPFDISLQQVTRRNLMCVDNVPRRGEHTLLLAHEARVYVDDGVSGCGAPGRVREQTRLHATPNALRPCSLFDVLIESELSCLGREPLETGCAVKQLQRRVFASSPTLKIARGHDCGSDCYGYRNVEVKNPDGLQLRAQSVKFLSKESQVLWPRFGRQLYRQFLGISSRVVLAMGSLTSPSPALRVVHLNSSPNTADATFKMEVRLILFALGSGFRRSHRYLRARRNASARPCGLSENNSRTAFPCALAIRTNHRKRLCSNRWISRSRFIPLTYAESPRQISSAAR
jgi:hypothetical protein